MTLYNVHYTCSLRAVLEGYIGMLLVAMPTHVICFANCVYSRMAQWTVYTCNVAH